MNPPATAAGTATRVLHDESVGAELIVERGRWITNWDPEHPQQWETAGRAVARRNLIVSVFAEFLGFCVWALWSIVVPRLPDAGFTLSVDQMFWLVAVPSLVGATLRIPYTFAVPVFGGRNWTWSAAQPPARRDGPLAGLPADAAAGSQRSVQRHARGPLTPLNCGATRPKRARCPADPRPQPPISRQPAPCTAMIASRSEGASWP